MAGTEQRLVALATFDQLGRGQVAFFGPLGYLYGSFAQQLQASFRYLACNKNVHDYFLFEDDKK